MHDGSDEDVDGVDVHVLRHGPLCLVAEEARIGGRVERHGLGFRVAVEDEERDEATHPGVRKSRPKRIDDSVDECCAPPTGDLRYPVRNCIPKRGTQQPLTVPEVLVDEASADAGPIRYGL